jgi:hypothetical protein
MTPPTVHQEENTREHKGLLYNLLRRPPNAIVNVATASHYAKVDIKVDFQP